ncbi:toxin-antitoxin system YwqK family antitoxin [Mesonia sp.]|uniref:toxin-antitoxin system YwqK family antitoxin n=1 Tax=Mesonia sp. TaxID=1960830 RepID=UPI003F9C85D5
METVWDKEGHKTNETPYVIKEKDSVKVSVKEGIETYWKEGKIASTLTYLDDKRNGVWVEYYTNGQVKSEKRFQDDQLHGKAKTYYEDGSLKSRSNYQKVYSSYEFVGWNYRYDPQGNLSSKFFADDKGKNILSESFENTEKTGLRVKDVLSLSFLPAGKLMSLDVIRFSHLPLLGFDFYSNGKLRRVKFTHKEDFHVKTVSFSAQGDVLEVESNDRSTEENKAQLIKIARKIKNSFNPEWLESDLITKPLEDKVYTLAYKDGSPFMRIQFQEGLPHGKWKIMSSVSKDTLFSGEFDHGKLIGDWIKKKADGTALDRKYFSENQVVLKAEDYFTDGRIKSRNTSNPDASRKTQREYYENGQLRTWEDYNKHTRAQYKESGDFFGRTYFKKDADSVKIRETYFQEKNQLKNIRVNDFISKKGYVKSYYENGQLKTHHELLDDQTDGVYKKYDEQGNLVTEGHFKEKKRDGSWKEYENGILVKESYFEKGEIIIDPKKEAPCACYDKTLRTDEIGFAQLTDNLATFSDYEPYLPNFLVPHKGLKNENFFFINFRGSQERDFGSFYMKLLMYNEFSFYLPANKQVKINLNPCKVEGYISNMRAAFGYNHKNKTINSVNFQPKRIAISLENNPLKAEGNENFTGYFDVNTFYISEKDIQIDYKEELKACFTEGIINDFLHVEVLEGKPSLQVDRKTQNYIKNYQFPILRAEAENFHGFEITDALLSFEYKQDGKVIQIEASSEAFFAGNNFVASTIRIKGTKLDEASFQLASSNEKIDLKKLERFLEQKNLYRLKFETSKKKEVLKIQFFAE